ARAIPHVWRGCEVGDDVDYGHSECGPHSASPRTTIHVGPFVRFTDHDAFGARFSNAGRGNQKLTCVELHRTGSPDESDARTRGLPVTAARKVQDNSAIPAKYRVVTTLGSGGTALVYLAVAERTAGFQKLVVLKTLLGHLANDPSVADMFRNEARIAARLKHPNVVEVYEVFDDLDQPVLVMEYLRGASLRDLVRKTADRDAIPL